MGHMFVIRCGLLWFCKDMLYTDALLHHLIRKLCICTVFFLDLICVWGRETTSRSSYKTQNKAKNHPNVCKCSHCGKSKSVSSTLLVVLIATETWQIVRTLHWQLVAEVKKKQSHQRHEGCNGRQDTQKLRRDWGKGEEKTREGRGEIREGKERQTQTEKTKIRTLVILIMGVTFQTNVFYF